MPRLMESRRIAAAWVYFLMGLMVAVSAVPSARAETFDATTFTPPAGWAYEQPPGKDHADMTWVEGNRYCTIGVFRAGAPSTGDPAADFESRWNDIVRQLGQPQSVPKPVRRSLPSGAEAWEGSADVQFADHVGFVHLLMLDAGARVAPIFILARDRATFDSLRDPIQRFLASVTVKKVSAPGAATAPRVANPAAPQGKKRIAVSDVVGSWSHSTTSYATYVSRSTGAYAGTSIISYGQGYEFAADGTYTYRFTGMQNGRVVREKDSGTWRFEGGNLAIRSRERDPKTYRIVEYQTAPDGTTFMTLLDTWYPPSQSNIDLYAERFARPPKKKATAK